jgi:hypothetical protein
MAPNCNALAQLDDFSDYVDILHDETEFDETRLEVCKNEICIAVYGTGNPDISGIGVCDALSPWLNAHLHVVGCYRLYPRVCPQRLIVPGRY